MELPIGRERLVALDKIRFAMTEQDRRVPRETTFREVGGRLVRDGPARARMRGAIVLKPLFPELPEPAPPEFDTAKIEVGQAA